MSNEKVYLIDASPIFYKAFYAIPPLSSKNGVQTNAAFGYTNTLIKILKKYNPEYIAVCFDKESTQRKELFNDYKIDRKKMPQGLIPQVSIIKKITELLGISVIEKNGYEADDLIGVLSRLAEKENKNSIIISPDKDLCQLVNDKVNVLDISKNEIYDIQKVKEKFGVNPKEIIDYLGLSGDPVDGIPGILGIGKTTAINLINEFGNIENIYLNIDKIKPSIRKKLENGKNLGEISKKLATIITDITNFEIKEIDQLKKVFSDISGLNDYFDALNFLSLKEKIKDLD